MATAALARQIGLAVKEVSRKIRSDWWYSPHMDAASRAVAERLPLVDLILEVRDARVPFSSEYEQLKDNQSASRRIIVMNKTDLANSAQTKEWMAHYEKQNFWCFGVNSHNRENIKQLLNFLQARIRELKKADYYSSCTITVMLVGVPNVGKSALANSLHKIGRISAAEKGKLKHATVSPQPCETQDISSLKIASHPNIYVLDTPGILPPFINDAEICSKLALTGTIRDSLAGEKELVQYFLSLLNSSEEYKKWENLSVDETDKSLMVCPAESSSSSSSAIELKRRRQYPSDHTQDFIVNDVRRTIYKQISSFPGDLRNEDDSRRLMELQITALREAFQVPLGLGEEDASITVCRKILNLYRTGRLGHYTLDSVPN